MRIILLLVVLLGLPGCFTQQAKQDQETANLICEEESIVLECRIAQSWIVLAEITNGVAGMVDAAKGTDYERSARMIGEQYRKELPKAEVALNGAQELALLRQETKALGKLETALYFIEKWQRYRSKSE